MNDRDFLLNQRTLKNNCNCVTGSESHFTKNNETKLRKKKIKDQETKFDAKAICEEKENTVEYFYFSSVDLNMDDKSGYKINWCKLFASILISPHHQLSLKVGTKTRDI